MKQTNLITVETLNTSNSGEFIQRELPVLLKGACKDWPAYQKWSPQWFSEKYGDVEVPMSNYKKDPYQSAHSKPKMAIRDYLDHAQKIAKGEKTGGEDLYSAGWFFCHGYCELLKDVVTPIPFENNWADQVQKVIHFDTRSILFGHPEVESPLHTDSFFVSTYFAMIRGQKRMRLVAPEHTAHVHNGYDVFDEAKVADLGKKGVPVYEVIIEEGDIVWFPPGWWHHVKNDTFTISLTTNFVSEYHFLPFEQQIRATLIKPLLNLSKVKKACLNGETSHHSRKVIQDSKFIPNEERYVQHFQRELTDAQGIINSFRGFQS